VNISITMPAPASDSDTGQEVTVTLTPKKTRQGLSRGALIPSVPPLSFAPQPPSSLEASSSSSVIRPPSPIPLYSLPAEDETDGAIAAHTQNSPNYEYGRKQKAFYVITRGRKIGVFYDFWCVGFTV
jgi:hypothetical protein